MNRSSLPTHANASVIEAAYEAWLKDHNSVDPTWRAFFQGFALASNGTPPLTALAAAMGDETRKDATAPIIDSLKQSRVHHLINTYRSIGHLEAHLDPLSDAPAPHPKLALDHLHLGENDLDTVFDIGTYLGGGQMKLRDIISNLRLTYCGYVGVEYMHIQDSEVRTWLQEKMETSRNQPDFSKAERIRILRRVHKAELFERFLHTKYVGQKRFSLEGGETMIAAVDSIIEACPDCGVAEVALGMAHRGRLNILTSVMRKSFDVLFEQFSENYIPDAVGGDGDVKYHLGYEAVLETASGKKVEIRLAANPSHLEIVNPVVEGKARARQRIRGGREFRHTVLPLLIHGDAAFAGQGVVAETLNFSQLPGYRTGGTLHIIVNNQIGFTTVPSEARSTRYCTDVAKMIEAPIFHVNGDEPESVCMIAELALAFREKFARDVVIDMYCYRKHGHNETDEPAFTQPLLYKKIATHPQISAVLSQELIAAGIITPEEAEAIKAEYLGALEKNLEKAKAAETAKTAERAALEQRKFVGSTAVFQPDYHFKPVPTHVTPAALERVVQGLTTLPADFKPNPKIKRFLDARLHAFQGGGPIDWGFAEALAFGTLLMEGTPVRLSGQDCERGTFSHRHAVLHDAETDSTYAPLKHLSAEQAQFCVYNSLLSEAAVLGFDYGYSLDYPSMLCIWEAQFGDFGNGAQVVIDQFISSGESKWQRTSGIVLLLPHGYEGQGPEHSSARLERFLQLCAENNIQVANITTPGNFFHALRRQMKREFQKPLIVMSPKSLLRHPAATSQIQEFTGQNFQEVIDDAAYTGSETTALSAGAVAPARLILCSGKVYYDLDDYRVKHKVTDTAIVRVEQLYPLHRKRLEEIATKYAGAKLVWAQEESENMGAWSWIAPQLEDVFGRKPLYAGRDASASPAVGSLALHKIELAAFLKQAYTL
jgi:2-oxoglutarate dehydrogenase E1 component